MNNLVIVESPTKARTLSKFLGVDYQIEASMGHVRDLPKSTLGVDVAHGFKPEYVVVAGREGRINELQRAAKKAKNLILATDPDREGEAIAFHVAELLQGKFQRIVFHEITQSAIEEALKNPGKINMHLVDAQQGRRVLDRLVGYKLSPLLWKKVRRGLSAGRVQSVAVRLIVEREKEIEAFKPEEFWIITVKVAHKPTLKATDTFVVTLLGKVTSKEQADPIVADLEKATYKVTSVVKKEVRTSPPPPYMTSTLQRSAANLMSWSSKKTMQVAQRLYERGLITYHRTDSLNIAQEALAKAAKYIAKEYGEQYGLASPRFYKKTSKSAQEAHEAIRPTEVGTREIEDRDLQRLYQMIWRRFVASQMAQAAFDRTTINVEASGHKLRAVGKVMKFDGWMKLYGKDEDGEQRLPEVAEGEILTKKKVGTLQKFTEPPARFNEASLIKALEERGIGRPSTYAPIISTIQTRQYVEKLEQRFHPTAVGNAVTEFLSKHFPEVMDYAFTAGMEDSLDKIASGEKEWEKVIGAFYGPFAKDLVSVEKKAERVKVATEKTGEKCPECNEGDVVLRIGRFGKFKSCSRFPKCKYTANFVESLEGIKCPDDGGEIVIKRTKTGRRFYGCKNYPNCKWASWRKPR